MVSDCIIINDGYPWCVVVDSIGYHCSICLEKLFFIKARQWTVGSYSGLFAQEAC